MSKQFSDLDKREIVEIAANHLDTVISLLATLDTRRQSDAIVEDVFQCSIDSHGKLIAYLSLLKVPNKGLATVVNLEDRRNGR